MLSADSVDGLLFLLLFLHGLCVSSTVWRLMMSNSCFMLLEFLIIMFIFIFDALTHLFYSL